MDIEEALFAIAQEEIKKIIEERNNQQGEKIEESTNTDKPNRLSYGLCKQYTGSSWRN